MVGTNIPVNDSDPTHKDWFPGLDDRSRRQLRKIFTEGLEVELAQEWMESMMTTHRMDAQVIRARLDWLSLDMPQPTRVPSLAEWLGYGLVTNSLRDDTYHDCIERLAASQPEFSLAWLNDIAKTTAKLWEQHHETISTILPLWYEHLLENINGGQLAEDDNTSWGFSRAVIAQLRPYAVRLVKMRRSFSVGGLLLTGPRISTFIINDSEFKGNEDFVLAHLVAH